MTSASVSLVKTAPMSVRRSRIDEVVLDDPVDHDVDAVGGVEVRVGVLLVDAPVGGPARVADAGGGRAGRRWRRRRPRRRPARRDGIAQVVEVADRAHRVDRVAGDHRDAGRVVAAVLQAREAFEQQILDGTLAYVADDAAHGQFPFALRHDGTACERPRDDVDHGSSRLGSSPGLLRGSAASRCSLPRQVADAACCALESFGKSLRKSSLDKDVDGVEVLWSEFCSREAQILHGLPTARTTQ